MNLSKLKKHIESAISFEPSVMLSDGSNAGDFFVADVVGNRRFAQNFGGYPRSEIAEINDAATLEMQKILLNQLTDYRDKADSQNSGKSDAEIALGHRSKYCQMPCEMQSWIEGQLKLSFEKREAEISALRAREAQRVAYFKNQLQPDNSINVNPE